MYKENLTQTLGLFSAHNLPNQPKIFIQPPHSVHLLLAAPLNFLQTRLSLNLLAQILLDQVLCAHDLLIYSHRHVQQIIVRYAARLFFQTVYFFFEKLHLVDHSMMLVDRRRNRVVILFGHEPPGAQGTQVPDFVGKGV